MKKLLTIVLATLFLLSVFAGCKSVLPQNQTPAVDTTDVFIGFLPEKTEEIQLQNFNRLSVETIQAYQPGYSGYGTDVYFQSLTEQEQTLYRIFQYALDQAQSCIFLDDRLLGGMGASIYDVLCCLALDNPMLEQNLNWTSMNVEYTVTIQEGLGKQQVNKITGTILQMDVFAKSKLDKKLEALQVAQQVVADMPTDLTAVEKAEYFYRYLGENTQYFAPDGQTEPQDYLYDAFITRKTNCDGYANAYALLCHLVDIPCMEKLYTPQDNQVGHTWNAILLDGVWYNVDATGSGEVLEKNVSMHGFCTSDALQQYLPDYPDRIPPCDQNRIPVDCTITQESQAGNQVKEAYIQAKQTNRNYVIAVFPDGAASSNAMQNIADALQRNISTRYYITNTGAAVYYIFIG